MIDKLATLGVARDALGSPPELSAMAEAAAHCWTWCDGWAPERWPVYAALHEVDDWHAMAELMRAIREAQRAGEGASRG